MKIAKRALVALGLVLSSVFIASPVLAAEPHIGPSQYSTAGNTPDIVAISIVMVVLLVVVLAVSTALGNLFEKKE